MRKCSKNNGKVQGARTDTLITNKKNKIIGIAAFVSIAAIIEGNKIISAEEA